MKARIELFNTSFMLHSDEDNEYIQSLLGYIRGTVDTIQEDVEITDPLKQAILSLLLITHELKSSQKALLTTNDFAVNSMESILLLLDEEKKEQQSISYNS